MKDTKLKYTQIGKDVIIMELKEWKKVKRVLVKHGVDVKENIIKAKWKLYQDQP